MLNDRGGMARRLDALEARLAGDSGDYGPDVVVTVTRYWKQTGPEDGLRAAAEQARIDQAVEALREEARARRVHVHACFARVCDDGHVQLDGVPWINGGAGPW